MEPSLTDRARGALLGTLAGDAAGAPYEGTPPEQLPAVPEMHAGRFTDDTQMTLALAESLAERGQVDERHLADAFVAAYDPARGYGRGTTEALRLIASGLEPRAAAARVMDGQGSLGNGAAMRVAPVAVRFAREPERLSEQAERSASVTHLHPFGVDGAVVQAAAVAAALRGGDVLAAAHGAAQTAELRHRIDAVRALLGEVEQAGEPREPPPAKGAGEGAADVKRAVELLGNSSAAHESVPTAIYAALAHATFADAVVFAVRCGGDADTIAAMAGAIAGARHGASAIPVGWLAALEQDARSRLERLAERLVR